MRFVLDPNIWWRVRIATQYLDASGWLQDRLGQQGTRPRPREAHRRARRAARAIAMASWEERLIIM